MTIDIAAHLQRFKVDGFTVIERLIDDELVAQVKEQFAPYLQGKHMGRNDFEGERSERIYALLAKAPAMAANSSSLEPRGLRAVARRGRPDSSWKASKL